MWIFGKLINSSWLALVLKSFSFTEMSAKNNLIFYLKQVSLCCLSSSVLLDVCDVSEVHQDGIDT